MVWSGLEWWGVGNWKGDAVESRTAEWGRKGATKRSWKDRKCLWDGNMAKQANWSIGGGGGKGACRCNDNNLRNEVEEIEEK